MKDGLADAIHLAPLTGDEVAELARTALGDRGADVVSWLVDRARGNPLFATSMLALLAEGADPASVPATVRDHVRAATGSLPAQSRGLLETAAVLGDAFELASLAALIDEAEFMAFEVDDVAVERLGQDGLLGDLAREEPAPDLEVARGDLAFDGRHDFGQGDGLGVWERGEEGVEPEHVVAVAVGDVDPRQSLAVGPDPLCCPFGFVEVMRASMSTASRSPLSREMELAGHVAWPWLITAGSPGMGL
jgi:hypothetical protein